MAPEAPARTGRHLVRSTLLIAASVAIVANLTVVTHELGHLVADRLAGVDAGIVIEPFRSSYVELREPMPPDLLGWPDAAGPLANMAVGVALFVGLWRRRRPALLPLLLWGPVAVLQESVNALVQLGTSEPGTDWMRIVDAGVPPWTVVAFGAVGTAIGLFALVALLPVAGVGAASFPAAIGVLLIGFGTYRTLAVLASLGFDYADDELARNLRLLGLELVLALVVAGVSRLRATDRLGSPHEVSRRAASLAAVSAIAVITLALVI